MRPLAHKPQVQGDSTWQVLEHPSPFVVLPSSHASGVSHELSPHVTVLDADDDRTAPVDEDAPIEEAAADEVAATEDAVLEEPAPGEELLLSPAAPPHSEV